jgi:hypothetical protein
MELRVLLEYFTSKDSFKTVLAHFHDLESILPSSDKCRRAKELIHQFRARLLYMHHTRGRILLADSVRDILGESMSVFPHNTIFLTMLETFGPWTGANDRVRTIIAGIRRSSPTTTSTVSLPTDFTHQHILIVRREIQRLANNQSSPHAVRRAFERAVTSHAGSHNPVLWRNYVIFEVAATDLPRAKSAFYRAIRACPWVKEMYMLAFGALREAMSTVELKAVYELMEDKELRLRVPLDDEFNKLEKA